MPALAWAAPFAWATLRMAWAALTLVWATMASAWAARFARATHRAAWAASTLVWAEAWAAVLAPATPPVCGRGWMRGAGGPSWVASPGFGGWRALFGAFSLRLGM
eukprot:11429034-Alexandrium_andersonii.AAC.1